MTENEQEYNPENDGGSAVAVEVAQLEETPEMRDAKESAELAAAEFGVEAKEVQMVDLAELKKEKTQAAEAVMGQQKLIGGKVIDSDNRGVLDKMRAAGNVSAQGLAKQMRLEADLVIKGVHVSDKFQFEGRTLITITRVDQKGILHFTNYEVNPNASLDGGADFGAFGTLSMAPKQTFTEAAAADEVSKTATESMLATTQFEVFDFNRSNRQLNLGVEADKARERGKNEFVQSGETAAEIMPASPDNQPTLSPETAAADEIAQTSTGSFVPSFEYTENIADQITSVDNAIRMTRFKAAMEPNAN